MSMLAGVTFMLFVIDDLQAITTFEIDADQETGVRSQGWVVADLHVRACEKDS